MKDATKEDHIKCQKEEKEFVTAEEERNFWEMNLFSGNELSLVIIVYSVFLQWKNLWCCVPRGNFPEF